MPRTRKRPIEVLSPEEVERLLKATSRRGTAGIRNRALIGVLYYSGLRLSEALSLKPRDIDLERGELNIRRGKGGRQRLAGINAAAEAHLALWMESRKRLGISSRHPVFCTFSKSEGKPTIGPLSPQYVQTMLKRLAKRAGIEKRCHPHGFRHSHAVHLLRKGVPLPDIQRQLGHLSLATTDVCLRGLGAGEHVGKVHDLDW